MDDCPRQGPWGDPDLYRVGGKTFEYFSTQFDLAIPVQSKLLDFATYFTVQYFNGYGESLRTYNRRTATVRAGFSLVRLR